MRQMATVEFDNEDTIITEINGTDAEIREYYRVGRVFNLGDGAGGDLMARVVSVDIGSIGLENMTAEEGRQITREIMEEAARLD